MRQFESLSDPDFESLFRDFEHSAFRLETLQKYNVEYECQPLQDFMAGRDRYTHPTQQSWVAGIRANLAAGKSMSRVHVIEEPLSDYVRFEIAWPYQDSVAAGEEVRVLPVQSGSWPDDLPQFDFWLFDSTIAWRMDYEVDGSFARAWVVDDPDQVEELDRYRRIAIAASIPLSEYKVD